MSVIPSQSLRSERWTTCSRSARRLNGRKATKAHTPLLLDRCFRMGFSGRRRDSRRPVWSYVYLTKELYQADGRRRPSEGFRGSGLKGADDLLARRSLAPREVGLARCEVVVTLDAASAGQHSLPVLVAPCGSGAYDPCPCASQPGPLTAVTAAALVSTLLLAFASSLSWTSSTLRPKPKSRIGPTPFQRRSSCFRRLSQRNTAGSRACTDRGGAIGGLGDGGGGARLNRLANESSTLRPRLRRSASSSRASSRSASAF